jgi:cytidylate kinase
MTEPERKSKRLVVAIDGPAGSGKSTAARRLAQRLGYTMLDTGAIYRTVALLAREGGVSWDDEAGLAAIAGALEVRFEFEGDLNRVFLGAGGAQREVTTAIRTPDMNEGASKVSRHPAVRAALLDLQRRLAAAGGVVAEGRDVGSVVFPRAEAKFFLSASPEVRARRRFEELRAAGHPVALEAVLKDQIERDRRDSTRATAPLRQAEDALEIDSSALGPDEVVARMEEIVRRRSAANGIDKPEGGV